MKKYIFITLAISLLLSSCGNNVVPPKETEENQTLSSEKNENETQEKEAADTFTDYEVEIVFTAMRSGEDFDIEKYVEDLNKDNNGKYYVYDSEHYAIKIKESERLDYVNKFNNFDFQQIVDALNENCPNVFKKVVFENTGKEIKVYVDKDEYKKNVFAALIGSVMTCGITADGIQAYNLIDVKDRAKDFKIIDLETEEVLYPN